jgi:hypothetical protein
MLHPLWHDFTKIFDGGKNRVDLTYHVLLVMLSRGESAHIVTLVGNTLAKLQGLDNLLV